MFEPDEWTWPDAYEREGDTQPYDCLNCGMCDECIERSIAAAEEHVKDGA